MAPIMDPNEYIGKTEDRKLRKPPRTEIHVFILQDASSLGWHCWSGGSVIWSGREELDLPEVWKQQLRNWQFLSQLSREEAYGWWWLNDGHSHGSRSSRF